MSITSVNPASTTATTSYEDYLLRQQQIASTTSESSYLRLLNAPPRAVVRPSSETLNTPSLFAASNNGLNGSFFSALAAQFDISSQLALPR